ncbi:MAG: M81 family metallopeptidase, partial [Anaerolineaceae bacterium]|nr:M81 family metallopeptidase [Anaerolineaceae bacterium]
MARIALTSFMHETTTFSPIPTTWETFRQQKLLPDEVVQKYKGKKLNSALSGFFDRATGLGHEILPLISFTEAEPSSTIPLDVFNSVMDMIMADLKSKGPFDGVFIDLHGAMVFGDFQDGEEEIARRIRKIVADIPIVGSLDTHGNINHASFELFSAFEGYRTYPHIDIFETGQRCASIMDLLLSGKPLYKAFRQLPFIMPVSKMPTTEEPSKSLFAVLDELVQDDQVVSGTIQQGFPSTDILDMGPSVFAYAVTQAAADHAADVLYRAVLDREADFVSAVRGPKDAVDEAIALAGKSEKPVILADLVDNPGGGSGSDTTAVME